MSNMTPIAQEIPRPEVDGLLREYFESEMPKPWPAFKAPQPTREKRPATSWSRSSGRLALAACVALLVAGYLTLAGFFPIRTVPSGVHDVAPNIAAKDSSKPADEPMLPMDK